MQELTRNFDWGKTSLGDPSLWPLSLRTTVGIVLHSAFPMFLFWGKDLICFYNDAYRPSLGDNGKHPALGKKGKEVWPEIWDFINPLINQVMMTGKPAWFEDQLLPIFRNGKIEDVYWTFSYSPAYGDDNSINGVFVTCTETTGKLLALKNLEDSAQRFRENERTLRNVLLQAPVAMCILIGPQHVIQVANKLMLEIWGKYESEVFNRPLFEALPDAREQGLEKLLADVYNTGEAFQASEMPIVLMRNGKLDTVYQNFVYEPYKDSNGAILGVLAISVDVTEQAVARRKIALAEEKARLAINSADLGVYEIDYATEEMLTDTRFKEIWDVDNSEAREDYAASIHPDDQALRKAAHEASVKSGHLDYQARIIWKDKSVHWTRVTGKVIYDEKGKPVKLIGIIQDITAAILARQKIEEVVAERTRELAEANKDLLKSNSELAQFAYIASHDLQEPLRKISTFASMLGNRLGDVVDDLSKSYLQKINSSSARMNSLIRDVLDYSRLVKENDVFTDVDLNKIAEHALQDYELLIEQKGASLVFENLPVVKGIPLQMSQLFNNIIGNSLKFSRKELKPVIKITASKLSEEEKRNSLLDQGFDYHKISFSDNGIGLKPEYREQIFNIFQRLHRKSEYEGTGIGLAMCKKIVLNHSGDLNADGSSENGAVFNVLLPVKH